MSTQPHWTLLDSFPATVRLDTDRKNHAQPQRMTAGVLYLERPLTPPENDHDPHFKLTFATPAEDTLWLAQDAVQKLHKRTSVSANLHSYLRCKLSSTPPDGTPRKISCVVFPMPGNDTPPQAFILTFKRPDNPAIVVSFSVKEFNKFIELLHSAQPN